MNELLHLLKQNARLSNEELAAMLGTTPAEVAAQIKKLEDDGIIKGYSVVLNDELAKTVMMYDEVESVSLMSGAYDLAVTVTGSSLKVIALFVAQRLSTIDGVLSTATHFVLKRYKEKGIFIEQEPADERGMVSP